MRNSRTAAWLVFACLTMLFIGTTASIAQAKTSHLLTMAACPPWKVIDDDVEKTKVMAQSCQKDIETITPALRKAFAVSDDKVMTRLDEEADYAGVADALTLLAHRAKPEDRVVIYMNFHGGNLDASYDGYSGTDEIIATYTEKMPADMSAASGDGTWLTMRALRNMIDNIKAEEIIVIFEVCEVASGKKDFRYDFVRRYGKGWKGREAIIFSSAGDQSAVYNEDGTVALFTETLSRNLLKAAGGRLRDIVDASAIETHRSRRASCMKDENLEDMYDDRSTYLDGCTQMPRVYDPYGLLDDIQADGTTLASRWNALKDRKVVASKPDPKKKSAADKSKDAGEDPFAWTHAYTSPQALSCGGAQCGPMPMPATGAYPYWVR
jgi:hypothetical protein